MEKKYFYSMNLEGMYLEGIHHFVSPVPPTPQVFKTRRTLIIQLVISSIHQIFFAVQKKHSDNFSGGKMGGGREIKKKHTYPPTHKILEPYMTADK